LKTNTSALRINQKFRWEETPSRPAGEANQDRASAHANNLKLSDRELGSSAKILEVRARRATKRRQIGAELFPFLEL
jgi:hypothetical protein